MSKILMYSDLHIGASRVDINKIKSTLEWINDIANKHNIHYIFNLGDTFDFYNHTKSKMKITPYLMSILEDVGHLFKGHYILRGNHEYHEEGDLLTILDLFGAVTVCRPLMKEIANHTVLLMPYLSELEIDKLRPDTKMSFIKYDYVFGHFDISGATFESGFKEQGKDSSVMSLFEFREMYIGHYHIPHKIRSNIWSVGSVQSRVKTDNDSKMGVTILDVVTGETEFIENPHAVYTASDTVKMVGAQVVATKRYNLVDEIDNFKLEKSGLEAIIDYAKSKQGFYDEAIVNYIVEHLEGLKS